MEVHHDQAGQQHGRQQQPGGPDAGKNAEIGGGRSQDECQKCSETQQAGLIHHLQQVVVEIKGLIKERLHRGQQPLCGSQTVSRQRGLFEKRPSVYIILQPQQKTAVFKYIFLEAIRDIVRQQCVGHRDLGSVRQRHLPELQACRTAELHQNMPHILRHRKGRLFQRAIIICLSD